MKNSGISPAYHYFFASQNKSSYTISKLFLDLFNVNLIKRKSFWFYKNSYWICKNEFTIILVKLQISKLIITPWDLSWNSVLFVFVIFFLKIILFMHTNNILLNQEQCIEELYSGKFSGVQYETYQGKDKRYTGNI